MRLLRVVVILGAILVVALWLAGPLLVDRLTPWAVGFAERATGLDIAIEDLDLDLVPPRARIRGLVVGQPVLLGLERAEVSLDAAASVSEWLPVVDATVGGLRLDFSADSSDQPDPPASDGGPLALPPIPPMRVAVRVEDAAILAGGGRAITVAALQAGFESRPLQGVRLNASGEGVALTRSGEEVVIERLDARLGHKRGVIRVDELALTGPKLDLRFAAAAGGIDGGGAGLRLEPRSFTLDTELGPVLELIEEGLEIGGRLGAEGKIGGPLGDPSVIADVDVAQPRWSEIRGQRLQARIRRDGSQWSATDLRITAADGSLTGTVTFDESELALTADVTGDEIDLRELPYYDGDTEVRVGGDVDLQLAIEPEIDGAIRAQLRLAVAGGDALPTALDLSFDDSSLAGSGVADLAEQGRIRAELARLSASELEGDLTLERLDLAALAGRLELGADATPAGRLDATAEITGSTAQPRAEITLDGEGLAWREVDLGELSASLTATPTRLQVRTLDLVGPTGAVEAEGRLALAHDAENQWKLRASRIDLTRLGRALSAGVELDGLVDGGFRASGPWRGGEVTGSVSAPELSVGPVGFADAEARVVWQSESWTIDGRSDASEGEGELAFAVRGRQQAIVGVEADLERWRWSSDDSSALIDANASLLPGPKGTGGDVSLRLSEVELAGVAAKDSTIVAEVEEGRWTISGELLGGQGKLEALVDENRGGAFTAELMADELEVGPLPLGAYTLVPVASGRLQASGSLHHLAAASLRLELGDLSIRGGPETLTADGPVVAALSDGRVELEEVEIGGRRSRLRLRGGASADGRYRAQADGEVSLQWLGAAGEALGGSKGLAEVSLEVTGAPAARLRLDGRVELGGAEIAVGELLYVTELQGVLVLDGKRVQTDALTAEIGGGRVLVEGGVDLDQGPDLRWQGRGVALAPTAHSEAEVSGKGTLAGAWDRVVLAGEIEIDEFLFSRDLSFTDLIPSFERALDPAPTAQAARPPLLLDLRIRAPDGLHVDSNIARIEGRGDLAVRGSARKPELDGRIEVIDGQLELRGRTFQVVNGVVAFKPEKQGVADIDFLAETVVDTDDLSYSVQVRVTGDTNRYRVDLESPDGLSETDVASLIAFGKTVSQLQSGSAGTSGGSGFGMDQVAGFAAGRVGKLLADEVNEVLPFDEVELRPGFSASTGEFEPQLRVGKKLSDDLYAWIAQTFGVQSQTSVEVSYDITSRVSTVLRWESRTTSQEGGLGGELSQRVEFWRLPSWLRWGEGYGGTLE